VCATSTAKSDGATKSTKVNQGYRLLPEIVEGLRVLAARRRVMPCVIVGEVLASHLRDAGIVGRVGGNF
jgi:hypothetical protein